MLDLIYFLPGRGAALNGSLGQSLQSMAIEIVGREITNDFSKLSLDDQATIIGHDLDQISHLNYGVVAHSYGAYLLLHAMINSKVKIPKLCLISPVSSAATGNGHYFKPPGVKRLASALNAGLLIKATNASVITGADDWQAPPRQCELIANAVGASLSIVEAGHRLPHDEVERVILGVFNG